MPRIKNEAINICVVGQLGSGKSSLTLQYTQHSFPIEHDPSVEDVYTRKFKYKGKTYDLNFLDTASQEDYSQLKDAQFQQTDGFIIVYSVTSAKSFSAASNILLHIQRIRGKVPPTILIGNQTDLTLERQVGEQEGESLVSDFGMDKYFEVSAKSNINVSESFDHISKLIIDSKYQEVTQPVINVPSASTSETTRDSETVEVQQRRTFTVSHAMESENVKPADLEFKDISSDSNSQVNIPNSRKLQNKRAEFEKTNGCSCIIM